MADPILGPAYPALLAFGLVAVAADGKRVSVLEIHDDGGGLLVWPECKGWPELCVPRDLQIDYADPDTRDRVCRALAAHCGHGGEALLVADHPAHWLPWDEDSLAMRAWISEDYPEPKRHHALRAVADAVWGPRG